MRIRADTQNDARDIDAINDAAFGETAQSQIIRKLRASGDALWSKIGLVNRQPVAHVQIYLVSVDGAPIAIGLGPVSVLPNFQNRGHGSQLIKACLADVDTDVHKLAFVLGHVDYYPRFGFRSEIGVKYVSPWPRPGFMGMRLSEDAPLLSLNVPFQINDRI